MSEPRVLVVDDDGLVLKLAKLLLRREGYEPRTIDRAEDVGDDDARWAALAIVDLNVGATSGLELVLRLRRANPALAVIGWSADDGGRDFAAWRLACDRFVLKPFEVPALLAIIDDLLRGAAARRTRGA